MAIEKNLYAGYKSANALLQMALAPLMTGNQPQNSKKRYARGYR
jgi:hypothetical protein